MDELTTYLLLDGAQIDDLLPQLYRLQASPTMHLLYSQTAYAEWTESGPVLVRVEPDDSLVQHFDVHWRATAGVRMESAAEESVLAEHLRSLVHARVEGGQTALFRFHDPRILSLWLEMLSPDERDHYMGPVQRFYLPLADGQTLTVARSDIPTEPARYAKQPWLSLNADQLDRLNGAKQTAFDERLLKHLSMHFPDELSLLDEAQRSQLARLCRESAARYGYSSADEVTRWSSLLLVFGGDFPQAPEHSRYRELLNQPGRLPAQRLDDVMLEAANEDKESLA